MSNKNVRIKVRALIKCEEIRDKSNPSRRPGSMGKTKNYVFDIPALECPYSEFLTRFIKAQYVLLYGNNVETDLPPLGITNEASSITAETATLNAHVDSQDEETVVTFDYGTTPAVSSSVAAEESPVKSEDREAVTGLLLGLTPNTKYYYRVKCVNATKTTYGLTKAFYTAAE